MNNNIKLTNKEKCCGCGVCSQKCPKNAISMTYDDEGFLYPKIDKKLCINCNLCGKNCCMNHNINGMIPQICYAGSSLDTDISKNAASGGIFGTFVKELIKKDFICYGSTIFFDNNKPVVKHIRIDNEKDIHKIQGSKYVQSDCIEAFKLIKEDLKNNKKVLFSGTPCQISALKCFLNKDNINNLYTVDIICHGVPSLKWFESYIDSIGIKGKIVDFKFRDKYEGWGLMGSLSYEKNNKILKKRIYPKISSYYNLFLNTEIYRESCYECKFSNSNRIGNITLGDYWGVEKTHPEYLIENGGSLDLNNGISCILINDDKGLELLNLCKNKIELIKTDLDSIKLHNHNLSEKSKFTNIRFRIVKEYKKNGFNGINKWFKKRLGIKYFILNIWILLPLNIRRKIKKIIKRK